MRRGDFSASGAGSGRFVEDSSYRLLLKVLVKNIARIRKINIFSQGATESFVDLVKSVDDSLLDMTDFHISDSYWSNDDEIQHFRHLASADLIIGSCSTYAVLAMMCSRNKSIIIGPKNGLFQHRNLYFNNCIDPLLVDNRFLNSMDENDESFLDQLSVLISLIWIN